MRQPKKRTYKLPKGLRRLHIDGSEYLYRIIGCTVLFFLEDRKLIVRGDEIVFPDKKGNYPYWFERGQWKRTSDGMITPGRCKEYLERYLREEKDS